MLRNVHFFKKNSFSMTYKLF